MNADKTIQRASVPNAIAALKPSRGNGGECRECLVIRSLVHLAWSSVNDCLDKAIRYEVQF
jgi:hypothetical protein